MPIQTLGLRLRHARKHRKLTQPQLAEAAGLKQPSISELETGETKEISGPTLIALCDVLKVRPEWLVTGKGEMEYALPASHGIVLGIEEAEAITRLRSGHPDWRRYVLGLAMVEQGQQELLLSTMRQAVPDYKVEQAFGAAPHVKKRR